MDNNDENFQRLRDAHTINGSETQHRGSTKSTRSTDYYSSSEEEEDPDASDSDFDGNEIIRPLSTRSKIVVNLQVNPDGSLEYVLDNYDRVRMKLIFEQEKLYAYYTRTIEQILSDERYQPKKRQIPIFRWFCYTLIQIFVLFVIFCLFIIFAQIALFNLFFLGVLAFAFKHAFLLA